MRRQIALTTAALLICCLALAGCGKQDQQASASGEKVKIGFLVKQPEEKWFQNEWKFADAAGQANGFDVVRIGVKDPDKVLSSIDNLAAQGAKGFVICTPDVRLGPTIVDKANQRGLKVIAVDDRFVDTDGKPMENVHYLGIAADEIGKQAGRALWTEMQKRGWKIEDTAALVPTRDELETARKRYEGAIEELTKAGFPADRIFRAPQKTTDVQGGRDAANIVLTQHGDVKHWLIAGMNDEAVQGAVRATENRNIAPDNVVGIGIGDGAVAMIDLAADKPSGFFGSMLISSKRHGKETAEMLNKWIKDGVEPPMVTLTDATLITRDNYKQVMKDNGLME